MILDTSVVVDIDRGTSSKKVRRLDRCSPHEICAATVAEYFAGVELSERGSEVEGRKLLQNAEEIAIKGETAREAGRIIAELTRKGELIGINDVYIAAVARVLEKPVLTADVSDFERVEGIEVVDWKEF